MPTGVFTSSGAGKRPSVWQRRSAACFKAVCLAALKEIGNRKGLTFLSAGSDGIDGNAATAAVVVVDSRSYEIAMCLHLRIDD